MPRIASFDIGVRNLACYVEDLDQSNPPPYKRKSEAYSKGKRVLWFVEDIASEGQTSSGRRKATFDREARLRLVKLLSTYGAIFGACTNIIIEQQFSSFVGAFKGVNVTAIKVAEFVEAWFTIRCPWAMVESFPATHKTACLGAPKSMSKPQRKKWAIEEAKRALAHDKEGVTLLGKKKADDLADCYLQAQAWKLLP